MSDFNDYFYLGKITKLHGYEGKVTVFFDTDEPQQYTNLEMVHMDINGSMVPFFLESINLLNNKAIAQFADVDTIEKAEDLVNKELYLPISMLPELTGNKFYYHEVPGMMVIDSNFGELGQIKAVLEYPNQAVLQVFHNQKEVLIPISDEVIDDFNRTDSTIYITAPDGLLEIYLDGGSE